jgi:hypothetical protein
MANRAVVSRMNPLLFFQPGTELFTSLVALRFPVEFGDILNRTQVRLGIAMAIDTPSHRQLFGLINLIHRVDAAVTGNATNAPINVRGMVKKDEVREIMHADPRNRLVALPALMDRPQLLAA